jgi:hypothetical protein
LNVSSRSPDESGIAIVGGPTQVCFRVPVPAGLRSRYEAENPALQVTISLQIPEGRSARLTEVEVELSYLGCDENFGPRLVEEVGGVFLASPRECLEAVSEQREQDRLPCGHLLFVYPLRGERELGLAVPCRVKNISPKGIGFTSPHELAVEAVFLQVIAQATGPGPMIPARIVWVTPLPQGHYDVGAVFTFSDD